MTYQGKQRALVKPGEAYLRDRARPPSYDDASIGRQRHQQVSGITHSTRDDHGGRPIRRGHFVRRDYADHQSTCIDGLLSRDSRGWAAATAYERYSEACQESAGFARQVIGRRSGFGASKNRDLGTSVRREHCGVSISEVALTEFLKHAGEVPSQSSSCCCLSAMLRLACNTDFQQVRTKPHKLALKGYQLRTNCRCTVTSHLHAPHQFA